MFGVAYGYFMFYTSVEYPEVSITYHTYILVV